MSMFTSGFAAKIDDMIDFRCAHAYADTEQKRKAIELASPLQNPRSKTKISESRFTLTDEEMIKRLTGLN